MVEKLNKHTLQIPDVDAILFIIFFFLCLRGFKRFQILSTEVYQALHSAQVIHYRFMLVYSNLYSVNLYRGMQCKIDDMHCRRKVLRNNLYFLAWKQWTEDTVNGRSKQLQQDKAGDKLIYNPDINSSQLSPLDALMDEIVDPKATSTRNTKVLELLEDCRVTLMRVAMVNKVSTAQ